VTNAMDLPPVHSGKVRDIYEVNEDLLLMVTSDRISAFDVVMAEPIPTRVVSSPLCPRSGSTCCQTLSPGHLVATTPEDVDSHLLGHSAGLPSDWVGRTMLCRRAEMLPIECIVRGYITGSAWKEYTASGTMHGIHAPHGPARGVATCRARVHTFHEGPMRDTTSTSRSNRRWT
jgi:phosphoribosylaminoimidazole-succinocarboxamide synthase